MEWRAAPTRAAQANASAPAPAQHSRAESPAFSVRRRGVESFREALLHPRCPPESTGSYIVG
eukprot:6208654-Pleurochrysis_carterae.AAC.2